MLVKLIAAVAVAEAGVSRTAYPVLAELMPAATAIKGLVVLIAVEAAASTGVF